MRYTRITVNPAQMGGIPCIRGLRIPVATVGIDNARNAAMLAAQIIALSDEAVAQAIETYRAQWNP